MQETPQWSLTLNAVQMLYNAAYGQFVLLFHADTVSFDYNAVGVAVSSSVTGPYKFVRTFHPDGLSSYDMGTFQVCQSTIQRPS